MYPHRGKGGESTVLTREDYERLHPKLTAIFLRKGMSEEGALDLVQATLLEAHESLGKFRGQSDLDTWVVSIAKNLFLQDLRKRHRLKRFAEEEVPVDESLAVEGFERRVIARDQIEKASVVMERLPEEQREAILLMVRGFKYREIAQILYVAENRVSSLIHQARKTLRSELGEIR